MRRSRRTDDVRAIARRISKSLASVGEDFLSLGAALQSRMTGRQTSGARARSVRRRARRALTPADRARLRLQGEYLGLVRHLSLRDRNKVKTLRSKKGYPPAIKMARRLVKPRG